MVNLRRSHNGVTRSHTYCNAAAVKSESSELDVTTVCAEEVTALTVASTEKASRM